MTVGVPKSLDPNLYSRASKIKGDGFPFHIRDATGVIQTLTEVPERIASSSYAADEALMLLVDPKRVVTVTSGVDLPGIHNAYGYYPPDLMRNNGELEKLISTRPDIVIVMDTKPAEQVKMLISAGITVIRFSFYVSFEQVDANLRKLAALLGATSKADEVLSEMWDKIARVEKAVEGVTKPRTLTYGMSGNSSARGTLNDDMIERAGAINIANEVGRTGSVKLPQELAISLQPEVILLGDYRGGPGFREFLYKSPAWKDVPAIRNRRVYLYKSTWGTTGSPFRAKAVEQIAQLIHPERLSS